MPVRKSHRWINIMAVIALAITLVGGTALLNYQHLQRQAARLPVDVRNNLTFSPFIVTLDNQDYRATDYTIFDAEDGTQHLSFYVYHETSRITVTQSVQSPQFTEIPEYKQRFLDSVIKQYATVQTANGTIYLGKQVLQKNKQLGIMLERGLVVLFNPEKDLTQAQWRQLGDQFDIQKISS